MAEQNVIPPYRTTNDLGVILLMLQKSAEKTTWDGAKTLWIIR